MTATARQSENGARAEVSPPALRSRRAARLRWAAGLLLATVALAVVVAVPALVEYYVWRGRAELARENFETARDHFRAAERLGPDSAETHFWLARISRKLGDLDGVRRHLEKARRLGFEHQERLKREWWLVLAETGRLREVEPYLTDMLTDPGEDAIEICDAFARGYCLNLQFEQAFALLDAWAADYPNDFRPHLRRGQIHAGDELQWTKAEAAFREALRRAPDRPEVHRELGKTLLDLRRLDKAEQHLRQALRKVPADAGTLLCLARTLFEQNEHQAARECLDPVLKHDPRNKEAILLLAKISLAVGEADEAIRQLRPLVELWPEDLKGRYALAEALRAGGHFEKAESEFETYAGLEQNWQRLNELNRMIQRSPHDPELRYEIGQLCLKHESRAEGVAWLQSVFQYEPDHAGAHRALADYYAKIDELELARRHQNLSSKAVLSDHKRGHP